MKRFFCLFALLMVFTSGCDFMNYNVPEENLKISYSRHAADYLYSDKVLLHLSGRYNDKLQLIINDYTFETVLEGVFIRVAHQGNALFIETRDAYYVFDIDSYVPQKESSILENVDLHYVLLKYSFNDFRMKYPLYEDYSWFNY